MTLVSLPAESRTEVSAPPPSDDRVGVSSLTEFLHTLATVVVTPFRTLAIRRHVIATLTRRDLRGRYASSMMGLSWAVIQPLALLLLYTYVFSVVLRIRLGGES